MIEDLDGATSEPSRRWHVAVLSAAVAAVSLALLMALVEPAPRLNTPPPAAALAPNQTAGRVVIFASDSTTWSRSDQVSQLRDDVAMTTVCVTAVGSTLVHHVVVDLNGQPTAAYTSGTTGRFIPLPQAYVGSGWFTVPCDASDVFAPRINRAR